MKNSRSFALACLYDKIANQISLHPSFYQNIAQAIGRPAGLPKILDIGCGNGDLLQLIAKLSPRARLYGLDFSRKMLDSAQGRLKGRARLILADALALPFSPCQFDLVLLCEVLEHLTNPLKGLQEAKRVLKNGGRLIITFPNASSYQPFYPASKKLPQGKFRRIFLPPEDPEKTFQPLDQTIYFSQMMRWLKTLGLKIINARGTVFFHYLGEVPFVSSLMIILWRKTPFDKICQKFLGPKLAYRVLIEAKK